MPPVKVIELLKEPDREFAKLGTVGVLCRFGHNNQYYNVSAKLLSKLVDTKLLVRDPPPTKWAIYISKSCYGLTMQLPVYDDNMPCRMQTKGYNMVYKTAGSYHTEAQALRELRDVPKRGGKRSVVITSDVTPDRFAYESDDTEYDSDGEPKPKKPKCRRKRTRKPHPENEAYRERIVKHQTKPVNLFDATGLGDHFCTVICQIMGRLDGKGKLDLDASVHLYTSPDWLRELAVQAQEYGNANIAKVADAFLLTKKS